MKILILCTGNSCRSQMTQGFLQSFNSEIEVHSAGTEKQIMNEFRRVRDEIKTAFTKFYKDFLIYHEGFFFNR